jgi:hypothetical protein
LLIGFVPWVWAADGGMLAGWRPDPERVAVLENGILGTGIGTGAAEYDAMQYGQTWPRIMLASARQTLIAWARTSD